jgi:hypothetical protein
MRIAAPIAIVCFAGLTACQSSPSEKWGAATVVYTQTNRTMTSLVNQGLVGLEAAERYESVRAPVGLALDVTYGYLIDGDDESAKSTLTKIADGLEQMQAVLVEVK